MKKNILYFTNSYYCFFVYSQYQILIYQPFEVLNNINILYLIIAASIYFSSQIISSERLRYILNDNKFIISFKQNFTLYLIGLFYNFFIPGGIGGDAYKSFNEQKV